jgi:hypothetical protein
MKNIINHSDAPHIGGQLKVLVKFVAFGGLFLNLSSTFFTWAGVNTFNCSPIVWEASLATSIFLFFVTWIVYLPFRNTDQLLGHGLLTLFIFFSLFFLFGFSMFYFYFLFSTISVWLRIFGLIFMTFTLFYRFYLISTDIIEVFRANRGLFQKIYSDERDSIIYNRKYLPSLQELRKDRNPFKSFHLYAALFVVPFVLVLNRLLTPFFGDGHGVYLILAFFSIPLLLWGAELFVQSFMVMIYYPIKLQRETGKQVILRN